MIELTGEMSQAVMKQLEKRAEDYDHLTEYDDSPWSDEERELLRAEAVEALGWEGMEAYQEDDERPFLESEHRLIMQPCSTKQPFES